ncbi:MAG: hypothetical protein KBT47_04075 [Armatimonadetes bacterium]|nr:hypothetical protein [Candidatus Hippobium faecium]
MISIESITAEWEDNSLWGTVIIYSDTDQTAFTDTVITLSGDSEYTVLLQEKLIAGKNELEFMFSPDPLLWFPNGCDKIMSMNSRQKPISEKNIPNTKLS